MAESYFYMQGSVDPATTGGGDGGPGLGGHDQHRDGAPGAKNNDIQPWIVQAWCLPPEADAEFVWRLEDVIQTYLLPYDREHPVVCFDEACKQLFGEVRPPRRAGLGRPARVDYEYERRGVCHQLMMCEPLRGWRHVQVTERRTRRDYAQCVRELVDLYYLRARKVRLVQDNLNTHDGTSWYEALPPAEVRRVLDRIDFHYTPKHGSWLNMAETEINVMNRQCLDRRIESQGLLAQEVEAWGPSSYWFPAAEAGKQPLPGRDQGSLAMVTWFHDAGHVSDPALVVWVGAGGGGRFAARTEPLAKGRPERVCVYEGDLAGVAVECRTSDGKTGTVEIGGDPYELAQGAVFLVAKSGAKPRVKQLRLATLNLKPEGALSPDQITPEYLRGLATTNAEINGFFTPTDQAK